MTQPGNTAFPDSRVADSRVADSSVTGSAVTDEWVHAALGTALPVHRSQTDAWIASGCAALSGWPHGSGVAEVADSADRADRADGSDGADVPASAAAAFADRVADALFASSTLMGNPVRIDGAAALAERARLTNATRGGNVSCNGTTRFVRCADGWVSLTLSRADDVDLLPACFEAPFRALDDPWIQIEQLARTISTVHIRDRATLVGLSCAIPDEHLTKPFAAADVRSFPPAAPGPVSVTRVVDLSTLWAGPLCAHLLHRAGCDVSFVEDPTRPDGARTGAPSFFAQLRKGHAVVPLELRSPGGIQRLRDLVSAADVVITSARPRAFLQMGIDPVHMMATHPIRAWMSVTGFGPKQPNRIGFGDDAAVAGGLWGRTPDGPVFAADALADPLTGLAAAALASHALVTGDRVHVELSLAGVAALAATHATPQSAAPT
jgi:CoA-transferase family III